MSASSRTAEPGAGGLRGRLLASFAVLVLLVASAAGVSRWAQAEVHASLDEVTHAERSIEAALRLSAAVRDQYAHQAHTIILDNRTHLHHYEDARSQVADAIAASRELARDGPDLATLGEIREVTAALDANFLDAILPNVPGDLRAVIPGHDRALALVERVVHLTDELSGRAGSRVAAARDRADAARRRAEALSILVVLTAVGLGVGVGFFLDRSITRPLRSIELGARRLASGDLSARIAVDREDELGSLARRFNEMAEKIAAHQASVVQSEKLAAIGRLAAGVAHEINNPLAVIRGYAALQRDGRGEPRRDAAHGLEEVARCQEIVSGLLDFTRPPRLALSEVDVAALARDVGEQLGGAAAQLAVRVEDRGPRPVQADAGKLRQILTNLLTNAAQAAPGGRVQVEVREAGEQVLVTVEDDGPGVPPEVRARLFEPFFTTRPGGTGLGLAVSRALARAHGGELRLVDSASGARFQLLIPRAEALEVA